MRDPDLPVRICATTAKARYRLRDSDLRLLHCDRYINPHYRSAAPMRLYYEEDVQELAGEVAAERALARERAPLLAAEKAAAIKAARRADVEALAAYAPAVVVSETGDCGLPLPTDTLEHVARLLGGSVEPTGVRGPGIVARDLCSMAATCRELRVAARVGFAALASGTDIHGGTDWATLLRAPTSMSGVALRAAARERGVPVSGSKADLAMRLLRDLGVRTRPSAHASPAALLAVANERRSQCPGALSALLVRARRIPALTIMASDALCRPLPAMRRVVSAPSKAPIRGTRRRARARAARRAPPRARSARARRAAGPRRARAGGIASRGSPRPGSRPGP